MLISALYDYAQYIDGFAPDGYEMFTVTHRIVLAKDGTMTNIVDVRKEKEIAGAKGKAKKQLVPESHLFPLRNAKKENAYLLEHRGKYIFGLDLVKNELIAKDKCYKSFVEVNADFFEKIDSDICKAVAAFAKKYTPEDFIQDTRILDLGKEVATAHFGFCLEGLESPLEEDSAFKKAYSTHLAQQETGEDSAFCCITGETLPIETTHKGIKIPHSKVTITKLVSMNANAFCSYNRKQSLNSCISQKASTQYAKVLNYLLSDKNHHKMIGDLALVYFAMKKNDIPECNWFGEMMDVPDWMKEESSKEADASLNSQFQKTTEGRVSGINEEDLDKDATFYVIGLVARSARICVKFVWKDRFGELVDNLRQHQKDMQMKPGDLPNVSFYSISREFISPKASDEERSKMDPEQTSELMYAAFNGTPYPQRLMYTMIRRIKTDSGMSLQRTLIRTGMVKACIARNQRLRNQKEEITMAWDETNQNPAYICGSLFAVYEKIQRDSAKGVSLNKTIKDSYFSSACSCPMAIMPRLEKLSSNHMKKFKEGQKIYYQNLTNSLMDSLNGKFPATMTLEEQGTFIIGYHQMNNWLYTKKEAGESDTNIEEE